MKRLEALADSIANLNCYHDPESDSYRLRNPGMLKAKTIEKMASANDDNFRIFAHHVNGYRALLDQLEKRCKRQKKASLEELLGYFGFDVATNKVTDFIYRATNENVDAKTPISFFLVE